MAKTSSKAEEERNFKNEVRELATKTAKTVIRKASIAPDYTEDDELDDDEDLEDITGFNLEIDHEPLSASDRFSSLKSSENTQDHDDVDVFDRFNKTEDFPVHFTIQRNGELLARKEAPYSWEELQAEFGKGLYKVIAKNTLNGRILKHESKSVAQVRENAAKIADKIASERDSVKDIITTVNNQFSESLNVIQNANQRQVDVLIEQMRQDKESQREKEERQRSETMEMKKIQAEAGNGTNTLLATLLPLLVKKDDGGSDKMLTLVMEMQKMNMDNQKETQRLIMEIQKENREEARRLQDVTNNMISKMVTELKPSEKKPDFDALTIMKMMQDAEAKGMDKMRDFMDLADERAERRFEEMISEKGDGEKDGGVIQSTLKLLLPALISQGMNKPSPAASPEDRLVAQYRPAPQQQLIPTNVVTAKPQPKKPVVKAAQPTGAGLAKPVSGTTQVHTVKPIVAAQSVDQSPKEATMSVEKAKELVINVATPILGEAFKEYLASNTFDSRGTAIKTVNALKQQGISAKLAVQVISAEDIIATCHSYGLASDETDQHLRNYYANIQASATT